MGLIKKNYGDAFPSVADELRDRWYAHAVYRMCDKMRNGKSIFYLAKVSNNPAGLLVATYGEKDENKLLEIGSLYISLRNKGVGKALLENALKEAKKSGFTGRVELTTSYDNSAMQHLASESGFKIESQFLDTELLGSNKLLIMTTLLKPTS